MNRKILVSVLILLLFLTGCSQPSESSLNEDNGKINVVSTIFPGYDFAREIAGEEANLTMLLPPGSESHSFEPTPQDIIKIQNCDLFIYVGGESDTWVKGILESMDTSNMKIISMIDLVEVVEEETKEGMEAESDHEEEESEYDEHVWTSPVNAIRIVNAVSDALCTIDEEHGEIYEKNMDAYVKELEDLDQSFRNVMQDAKRDTLIFGDRFPFRYFVDEYGLDYYAAFPGCSTETEASAQTVAFLIDKVREEEIPVVFHIEFSNEKMADVICESTEAKKLLLHSCHNLTKNEFESGVSYLDLMKQNVEHLREAVS